MSATHAKHFGACLLGFGLLLTLSGCAHGKHTTQEEAPAPPRAAPPQARVDATEMVEDFMLDHFIIATWSRDALIDGDLEALREPLAALAAHDYRSVAPGGWMPYVAKMQHVASLTSSAKTLDAAATGIATMARTCAECHADTGGGPSFTGSRIEERAPESDTLGARMRRHAWAADRMWEGLTGPSDERWTAGAVVLAHAPLQPPVTDPPLPVEYGTALTHVRELGAEALESTTREARADVYAKFLASCADCHALQVQHEF